MAKIRGIKPDFWTDDDIVELSAYARLLYIGLWNFACDNGHVEDRPRQIKMRVLPADDVDVDALLDELTTGTRITRSEGWVTIPNLGEHQRIDKRYFTTCPKPECTRPEDATPRSSAGNKPSPDGRTTGARRGPAVSPPRPRVDGDGDGDGESEGESEGDRAPIAPTTDTKRGTRIPGNFSLTPEMEKWAAESTPLVNPHAELPEFVDYWRGVAGQKGVKLDWISTWRNAMRRKQQWAEERGATRPSGGQRPGEALWDLPPTGTDR